MPLPGYGLFGQAQLRTRTVWLELERVLTSSFLSNLVAWEFLDSNPISQVPTLRGEVYGQITVM